jgi:hypothetical protein
MDSITSPLFSGVTDHTISEPSSSGANAWVPPRDPRQPQQNSNETGFDMRSAVGRTRLKGDVVVATAMVGSAAIGRALEPPAKVGSADAVEWFAAQNSAQTVAAAGAEKGSDRRWKRPGPLAVRRTMNNLEVVPDRKLISRPSIERARTPPGQSARLPHIAFGQANLVGELVPCTRNCQCGP